VRPISYLQAAVLGLIFTVASATVLGGCGGSSTPTSSSAAVTTKVSPAAKGSHTVLIVLENREFDEVIGASDAPYLNQLAARGALALNYHAIAHPSLLNYLALAGGSTFGIDEDCTDCHASGPNLATQLAAAGESWRAYMGEMPSPCFTGAESGDYAKRHNPFMYFPSVTSDPSLCARDVPETELQTDLAQGHLPSFAWISPDLCDDAHNCGFNSADEYLRGVVPQLLRGLGPSGLLAITFDEGTTNAGCCDGAAGGRIATILLGPQVRRGARLRAAYSTYSLLATVEDRFGLARLREAKRARALSAAFTTK
jgi:hypothetical protein